jgi:hypothetical protein
MYRLKYVFADELRFQTGCMIGVRGFDSQRGLGIFLFSTASRPAPGPNQPPIQWSLGTLSPGVKKAAGMLS